MSRQGTRPNVVSLFALRSWTLRLSIKELALEADYQGAYAP